MSLLENIKSSVKSSIIYSFGNLSSKLVGFILIPLYTSYLTVDDYAVLAILEISSQLIIAVFGFRISTSILRLYWDKDFINKQKLMFFTSIVFLIVIGFISISCLVYFSTSFSLLFFGKAQFSYVLKLMFICSGFQLIALHCLTQIRISEDPWLFTISNFIKLITTLSFTVYFITYQNKNIEAIYESQLIGYIIFFLYIFRFIKSNIEIKIEWPVLRAMLSFGSPLILAEIASVIFTITSRYCLNFLSTLHEVGIFSLGFKVANILRVFIVSSVMLAISPMIFKKINDPDCKRFYSKIMTYFSFGLMLCVLLISVFGKELLQLVAKNKDYWAAESLIPILSFAVFFSMLKDVSLTGLHISKRTGVISGIISSLAIINLTFNIIFILLWQSYGASIATFTSQILFFIIIYRASQRQYFIPYEIHKVLKITFVGILIYVLSLLLTPFNLYIRLVIKFILIIIFPFILYLWNFYEEIELIRLKQSWNKWKKIKNWRKISFK